MTSIIRGDATRIPLPDCSVDAVVTDPPYEYAFMSRSWDSRGVAFDVATWREVLRVMKPGAHLLSFGGTRTYHRMTCAIEDADFEVRDCLAWLYGSGFPKSLDVGKAIDKAAPRTGMFDGFASHIAERRKASGLSQKDVARHFPSRTGGLTGCVWNWESGANVPTVEQWRVLQPMLGLSDEWWPLIERVEAERERVGTKLGQPGYADTENTGRMLPQSPGARGGYLDITAPATPEAEQWQGWGTALKPAHEPIVLARKPLTGTVAQNVLRWGTGALNVDGCRVEHASDGDLAISLSKNPGRDDLVTSDVYGAGRPQQSVNTVGRWPPNVTMDEEAARLLDEQSGERKTGDLKPYANASGAEFRQFHSAERVVERMGDTGGASRFFYVAKASRAERGSDNTHPTVKPLALMRWLVRLVTPPGGTCLDPFLGSGTTLLACAHEGLRGIGIEREAEYVEIAKGRLSQPIQAGMLL